MRILHLVSRSQRRGAELVALELARELEAFGHSNRVLALALGFDGREDHELPALTNRSDGGGVALVRGAWALRAHLAAEPADVVIAHGGRAVEAAVLVRRRAQPRVVWQRILGFPPAMAGARHRLRWRAVARRVDAAVALTPELGDELRGLGFAGPIWTIPNFRDPAPFAAVDRADAAVGLRARLDIPGDAALIGFVGHLIEQKRPDRALDTLAAVHGLQADEPGRGEVAHLVLAGDGPLRAQLERDIRARGLERFVHVLGHRDDIPQVLGGIDVFILTSDDEGLPGVLIEAQMAGCPIVTVPVGGVRSLIDDGETGVVTSTMNADDLATRVVGLMRDPELRARLGEQARNQSSRFSSSKAATTYATHLTDLVSSRDGET